MRSLGLTIKCNTYKIQLFNITPFVGSVIERLKRRALDQHGLGSKSTCAILLCPWERHFEDSPLLGGLGKQF